MANSSGLSAKQLRLLGELRRSGALDGYYLGGGCAVGWLCRHRRSADLDFFSLDSDAALEPVVAAFRNLGAAVRVESNIMIGFDTAAGPVDVVKYPYRLLKKPQVGPADVVMASILDLAVMKVAAIARRGLRRDFWDLFMLLKKGKLELPAVLEAYRRRYGTRASDTYHLLRALVFFDDAERDDPRLLGLTAAEWRRIKAFFEQQAIRLLEGPLPVPR